ncbi:MAG: hypothetical protein IIB55_09710 [Planctomycetes bacterium]|nr:hypothetical protein [Planctomycetota bacterium]
MPLLCEPCPPRRFDTFALLTQQWHTAKPGATLPKSACVDAATLPFNNGPRTPGGAGIIDKAKRDH